MTSISADEAYRLALASHAAGEIVQAERICRGVLSVEPGHPAGVLLAAILMGRGLDAEGARVLRDVASAPSHTITLDYPVPRTPRYAERAHERLHALLAPEIPRYRDTLQAFCAFEPFLQRIGPEMSPSAPGWINPWLPALDAVALYGFVATRKPRRYIEIGSGHSTRFVRRAIEDHHLDCELISIDPAPRAEIDDLCDVLIREPLEQTSLDLFADAQRNDVVFLDSSHRCFMGSDVTVFFMELLPALQPGVMVGIHDIYLPYDYPATWTSRYYSEQYLLACFLLAGSARLFDVVLPAQLLVRERRAPEAEALCGRLPGRPEVAGAAFWIETAAIAG